jgi:hypothetical protein
MIQGVLDPRGIALAIGESDYHAQRNRRESCPTIYRQIISPRLMAKPPEGQESHERTGVCFCLDPRQRARIFELARL